MRVLNLVTTRSPFFRQQVGSVESRGVRTETVTVPGPSGKRRRRHYLRFYKDVLASNPLQYDLVHANYGLTAPFGLFQPTRPAVLTLWGSDLMGRYGTVSRHCARGYDEVIVRSPEMRAELGLEAHVIPAGVDFERFRPIPQREALEAVGWDAGEKHVLFPYSPDRPVKNHPLARAVVDAVDERFESPVRLEVVTGVDHERIPLYMNAADVLLITSEREGSPNTIKEAMACNTPIVSTDVGDVRTRLKGVSQSMVGRTEPELVDALHSVLASGTRSDGRGNVRHLRLERTSERILDVYERALGR